MFYAKRLSAANLKAPDKSKELPALPFSQSGEAPVLQDPIRPTQLPEAGAHSLEL
jgi:hypothetical protein